MQDIHQNKDPESELAAVRAELERLENSVQQIQATNEEPRSTRGFILLGFVSLALLAVLVAGYFAFLRAPKKEEVKQAPVQEVATTTEAVATTSTTTITTYKDSTEWYDVSVEYPESPAVVKDMALKQYQDFAEDTDILKYKNYTEAKEGLNLFSPDSKYLFSTVFSTTTSSTTDSYIFETNTYTGGAHGGVSVTAITLDKSGKEIPVTEIIKDSDLPKVAAEAKRQINIEKRKRLSGAGISQADLDSLLSYDDSVNEGTKPTRENYSSVWIDGEDIVIHFGQYQVGAYAEGMYNVRIKRSFLQ
jgi:hypothetical protein